MRLYYIISRLLPILPSIDFAVPAPVPVQEKLQTRVNVVHTPENTMTMMGKRGNELENIWFGAVDHPESHFSPNPEELPAAHPSSNPPPSGPADVPMDFQPPLPPFHEEQLSVSSQEHVQPSTNDEMNRMWRDLVQGHIPEKPESSAAHPSSSSQSLGLAGVPVDVGQAGPPIEGEPFPASQDHVSPSLSDQMNKVWRDLVQGRLPEKPEESSAAHPPSSSQSLEPVGVPTDVEQPRPSIDEGPLPVSSQDHVPPSRFPAESEGSPASGPTHEWTDIEQAPSSIPKGPGKSPVSSSDYAPPRPGDVSNSLWRDFFKGLPESHPLLRPEGLSATHTSLISLPSRPADGSTNVEQLLSYIPKEPSLVAGPGHALLNSESDDDLNKVWVDLFGHRFFGESSAARPSWASQPSGPAHEWMDVGQPLPSTPEEWLPVSSLGHAPPSPGSLTESGYELTGSHALPNPGLSAESDHEMMDVPRSILRERDSV